MVTGGAAAADMLGDEVAHVQMALNAKTGTIGILPDSEDTAGACRLRTQPKGRHDWSAASFTSSATT